MCISASQASCFHEGPIQADLAKIQILIQLFGWILTSTWRRPVCANTGVDDKEQPSYNQTNTVLNFLTFMNFVIACQFPTIPVPQPAHLQTGNNTQNARDGVS